jgi:Ti type entry exclusion protein TrbK
VSRLTILLAAAVVLIVGAVTTIFISLRPADAPSASEASPSPTPSDAEKRRRAEQFFGGDPNRDVRGGQEMKPRW